MPVANEVAVAVTTYRRPELLSKLLAHLLVQCEAGLLSITGTEETPCKAGIPVADIAAGMYAFSAILAALLRRGRSVPGSADPAGRMSSSNG